jgi:hypothetical protein
MTKQELWKRIHRLCRSRENWGWRGSQGPADVPALKAELDEAYTKVDEAIDEVLGAQRNDH